MNSHPMKRGFLIDMDGVIYRGSHLIPGADKFVQRLRTLDIPFLFLTNNSQRTRRDMALKLMRMGIEDGIRPGCGAIVAMLEKATGISAFSVGKPSPVMLLAARKELNLRTAETTMIGDMMSTDILGGVQMGYNTVLVLSGGTRREDL